MRRANVSHCNGGLVISPGTTGYVECETLLLHHLSSDPHECSRDDFNIFACTSITWLYAVLDTRAIRDRHRHGHALNMRVIEKMSHAAAALSERATPRMHERQFPDDADWLHALKSWLAYWEKQAERSTQEKQTVTGLIHTFQKAYTRYTLHGDQKSIWEHLHRCLKLSHAGDNACAVDPSCPWRSHICSENWHSCPLLPSHDVAVMSNIVFLDPWCAEEDIDAPALTSSSRLP